MEEEALRNHCGRMIRHLVRNKQQQLQCVSGRRAGGRQQSSPCERRVEPGDESRDDGTSLHITGQGPSVQPVPPQLISMLRLRTFNEEMRRAAEAELHDPAVCAACEQERASLALKRFIRRKTQLQFQTLRKTQHTHTTAMEKVHGRAVGAKSPPCLDLGGTTWQRYEGHSNLGLP